MVNSLLIMENSARILSILSMKKLFITKAIVRGESCFGNVVCLFRPSKVSTILKSFFSDHHCSLIFSFAISQIYYY